MPRFPQLAASIGEPLYLPVPLPSGQVKEYAVPPADAETWTQLTTRFAASGDDDVIDDPTEADLYRRWLGPVYDELEADGAAWEQIRRCGVTVFAWHVHGEEAALRVWEGGLPKPRSTSTTVETETPAEDRSTPQPASANGTTRSRKTAGSRGRTSSTGGSTSKRTSTSSTASTSAPPASSDSGPATG
ncbi:hypothetical protein [Nonomuraea sp. PA05]|uniref:DUF7426 family protein n=1 Tax=Nonomuraea sp. PA05 TaxID=2604466 RepID=UPI001652AD0A|nr:hypothetical protein [Nonomuraea sp. PA05]